MIVIVVAVAVIALSFGAFLRGAPYVPTHRRQAEVALDLLDLPQESLVVDLGSGDGSFLLAAARRGLRAYGYEINPLLYAVSKLRCRRYQTTIKLFWRDFWLTVPPAEIDGLFVFSSGPYMKRLARWLEGVAKRRKKSLYVVSYGFTLPGRQPLKAQEGMNLYRFDPM